MNLNRLPAVAAFFLFIDNAVAQHKTLTREELRKDYKFPKWYTNDKTTLTIPSNPKLVYTQVYKIEGVMP